MPVVNVGIRSAFRWTWQSNNANQKKKRWQKSGFCGIFEAIETRFLDMRELLQHGKQEE